MVVATAPHICFLSDKTKEGALRTLVSQLSLPQSDVLDAVLQRERVISTGIGIGIAIPHAKIVGLDEFSVVIGIVKHEGIEWDAIDKLPVRLVMLICGPDDRHKEYLQLLSRLTKTLKQESVRQELLLAEDADAIARVFAL